MNKKHNNNNIIYHYIILYAYFRRRPIARTLCVCTSAFLYIYIYILLYFARLGSRLLNCSRCAGWWVSRQPDTPEAAGSPAAGGDADAYALYTDQMYIAGASVCICVCIYGAYTREMMIIIIIIIISRLRLLQRTECMWCTRAERDRTLRHGIKTLRVRPPDGRPSSTPVHCRHGNRCNRRRTVRVSPDAHYIGLVHVHS
jgi:hypothetical protein